MTYVPFSLGLSLNKTYARSRFLPGVAPGVAGAILNVHRDYRYLRVGVSARVDVLMYMMSGVD